ncbi:MAG: hypothetical protein M3457_09755, partial [Chloroflexota bacterium]|nr:hypothetical protein [Chloroflexota bacterium]
AGIYSTARYLGSVAGSTVLAALFAQRSGDVTGGRFVLLFAGLSVVAVGGVVANSLIAARRSPRLELESVA